jgi:adenylylsulfate reductase subunit A
MTFPQQNVPRHCLETDVLVLGGGNAGTMAALAARRKGVEVALVDKANINRSGCSAAGIDHFCAILDEGPAWDTRAAFLGWYNQLTQGLIDIDIPDYAFLSRIKRLVQYLESLGINMRLGKNNTYLRTRSFMQPGEYYINFDGRDLKPLTSQAAEKAGAKFFKQIAIVDLLKSDGRVVGAVGFHIRTGEHFVFRAKATIVATGNVGRLYNNQANMPFNAWHSPFNNGGAQAWAFRAGAELKNMEFVNYSLTPVNFGASGFNAIVGMGGYIVNAMGERFLFKYHELGEKGPRWIMPLGVYEEMKAFRGPCYFDIRHLPEDDYQHLITRLLPVDKNTFLDYCEQKGVDLRRDLLEIQITEGGLPAFMGSVTGVWVDRRCATSVPGLYAAGGCAAAISSLAGAVTTGDTAGEEAAADVLAGKLAGAVDEAQLDERRELIYAPAGRQSGYPYAELEDKLRQVMTLYVGIGRNANGLRNAQKELEKLARCFAGARAENGHDLMRLFEVRDLILVGQAITRAALAREETRFGIAHYRGDFSQTRPEWHCSLHQQLAGDKVTFKKIAPSKFN